MAALHNIKILSIAFVTGFGLLTMTGCYSPTVNTVRVPSAGSGENVVTDSRLAGIASVKSVKKARTNDLLRVQVDVANETSSPHEIAYRFVWLDEGGFEIPSPMSAWQRNNILARQTIALSGIAPLSTAVDCRVEIKRTDADAR